MKQNPRRSLALLALTLAAAVAMALLPPRSVWAGPLIALLTVTGYGSAAAMLHLFLFPVRLRRLMPGGAVPLTGHRRIAMIGLALAVFHIFGYLALEPASLSELSFAAPLYMQAGLAAFLLMILVGITSRWRWRQYLAQSPAGFRGPHLLGSALLLMLIALHCGGAGLWLDGRWKAGAWSLSSAIAIAGLLRVGHHARRS